MSQQYNSHGQPFQGSQQNNFGSDQFPHESAQIGPKNEAVVNCGVEQPVNDGGFSQERHLAG